MSDREIRAFAVCIGDECAVTGLSRADDGSVRSVEYNVTDNDELIFSLPDIESLKGEKFKLGPASDIVALVVKYGRGVPEIQAIHTSSDAKPLMCCYCGRVKVCAQWCSCG